MFSCFIVESHILDFGLGTARQHSFNAWTAFPHSKSTLLPKRRLHLISPFALVPLDQITLGSLIWPWVTRKNWRRKGNCHSVKSLAFLQGSDAAVILERSPIREICIGLSGEHIPKMDKYTIKVCWSRCGQLSLTGVTLNHGYTLIFYLNSLD